MKHIKPYEYFKIEIGDWILFKDAFKPAKKLELFTTTIPGKVIATEIDKSYTPTKLLFTVKYYNIPDGLESYFEEDNTTFVYKDEIIAILTEDEAQTIFDSNKYNL